MNNSSCFIIAEAGVNHNGSVDLGLELIDAAVAAGVDAVKFQVFKAKMLVARGAEKAAYQKMSTGSGSQYEMLEALELSAPEFTRLADYCGAKNIEFMATAFDESSADFLLTLGIKRIKVPSGELTNLPFIRYLADKTLPLILSTGMASLGEVIDAVDSIREVWGDDDGRSLGDRLTILHCTSNYPTALSDVNLSAMKTLEEKFSVPVGYSDHTAGSFVAPLAVAMGATVVEKHFTTDRSLAGPDHDASLEPDELQRMVLDIRKAECVLGRPEKLPTDSERELINVVRRSIMLDRDIMAGDRLTRGHLILLRPGDGLAPKYLDEVVGRVVSRNLAIGHSLQWEDMV